MERRLRLREEWEVNQTRRRGKAYARGPLVVRVLSSTAGLDHNRYAIIAGKKVGNFVQGEVLRHVVTDGLAATFPVAASSVAELLACVEDGSINGKIAKKVFAEMVETGKPPKQIIDEKGLAQVTDTGAIEDAVRAVIEANPSQVEQYKGGKENLIGYFVGQVMKATKGAANPKVVNETLRRLLGEA